MNSNDTTTEIINETTKIDDKTDDKIDDKIDAKIDNKIDDKIVNEILTNILSFLEIKFSNINELIGIEIDRDDFLDPIIIQKFKNYQIEIKKKGYSSGKLTSLHKNNIVKQQFPAINMMRQLLKCNGLWLKPKYISLGYNKNTGSKIIKRSFVITLLNTNKL